MLRVLLALAVAGCAAGPPRAPQAGDAATVALGQRAVLGGIAVTPLRIEEDSRCPTGVQCIQAGTVRVAVRLVERGVRSEAVAVLARPFQLSAGRLTLCAVSPYPVHPGRVAPAAYRFRFALDRGSAGEACAAAAGG